MLLLFITIVFPFAAYVRGKERDDDDDDDQSQKSTEAQAELRERKKKFLAKFIKDGRPATTTTRPQILQYIANSPECCPGEFIRSAPRVQFLGKTRHGRGTKQRRTSVWMQVARGRRDESGARASEKKIKE